VSVDSGCFRCDILLSDFAGGGGGGSGLSSGDRTVSGSRKGFSLAGTEGSGDLTL
jgi:hypothetical protein